MVPALFYIAGPGLAWTVLSPPETACCWPRILLQTLLLYKSQSLVDLTHSRWFCYGILYSYPLSPSSPLSLSLSTRHLVFHLPSSTTMTDFDLDSLPSPRTREENQERQVVPILSAAVPC